MSKRHRDTDVDREAMDEKEREREERRLEKQAYFNSCIKQWKDRKNKRQDPKERNGRGIRFRCPLRNTILDVFREMGYRETESETEWDIFWAPRDWMRSVYDKIRLDPHQRVNHFRNYYELTRKDCMLKNLKRMRRELQREGRTDEAARWDFWPETFHLPSEYLLFVEAFKKCQPNQAWIMKPIGSCQGKGIFLFDKLKDISEWRNSNRWQADSATAEKYIVQQYIDNPLLVGGKKFDLRLYVLVTSYSPLTIYIYREGFCRFSTMRFTMENATAADTSAVHLSNVAIQKHAEGYDDETGGKWDVRTLKLYLIRKYGVERINELFCAIQLVVIRSLLSVKKVMINDKNCFAVYGYDIMIDDKMKVWLIEINACPSLTASTPADYKMKTNMLKDALTIVDQAGELFGDEEQVGGFDLIYKNGFITFDENCVYTSYLGCANHREVQVRKLSKQLVKRRLLAEKLEKKKKEEEEMKKHSSSKDSGSDSLHRKVFK